MMPLGRERYAAGRTSTPDTGTVGGGDLTGVAVEETQEPAGADGSPKELESVPLDLADPFAGQLERVGHFGQRERTLGVQAESEPEDLLFPGRQGPELLPDLFAQERQMRGDFRRGDPGVGDQIAERPLPIVPDWSVQGPDARAHLEQVAGSVGRKPAPIREFVGPGPPAQRLGEVPRLAAQMMEFAHQVGRQPDESSGIRQSPEHPLKDPPRRVRGKLVSPAGIEFFSGPQEPQVAVLDEIDEREAAMLEALRDGHHEPQICTDEESDAAIVLGGDRPDLLGNARPQPLSAALGSRRPGAPGHWGPLPVLEAGAEFGGA